MCGSGDSRARRTARLHCRATFPLRQEVGIFDAVRRYAQGAGCPTGQARGVDRDMELVAKKTIEAFRRMKKRRKEGIEEVAQVKRACVEARQFLETQ